MSNILLNSFLKMTATPDLSLGVVLGDFNFEITGISNFDVSINISTIRDLSLSLSDNSIINSYNYTNQNVIQIQNIPFYYNTINNDINMSTKVDFIIVDNDTNTIYKKSFFHTVYTTVGDDTSKIIDSVQGYDKIDGCTDSAYIEYNPLANYDDGSCSILTPIYGCTNINASNYNSIATVNDGTCVFPSGCTNSMAQNYDSEAVIDDGSCNCNDIDLNFDFLSATGETFTMNENCNYFVEFDMITRLNCEDIIEEFYNSNKTILEIFQLLEITFTSKTAIDENSDFVFYSGGTYLPESFFLSQDENIYSFDIETIPTGIVLIGSEENCALLKDLISIELGITCDNLNPDLFNESWTNFRVGINTDLQNTFTNVGLSFKNFSFGLNLLLDNIKLIEVCENEKTKCEIIPPQYGFDISLDVDNSKAYIKSNVNYINSKKLEVSVSPVNIISKDIKDYFDAVYKNTGGLPDFEKNILNNINGFFDVKNRQTIREYIPMDYLYNLYLIGIDCLKSKGLNYNFVFKMLSTIDFKWLNLLNKVIPATAHWDGNTYKLKNNFLQPNKHVYRKGGFVINSSNSDFYDCSNSGTTMECNQIITDCEVEELSLVDDIVLSGADVSQQTVTVCTTNQCEADYSFETVSEVSAQTMSEGDTVCISDVLYKAVNVEVFTNTGNGSSSITEDSAGNKYFLSYDQDNFGSLLMFNTSGVLFRLVQFNNTDNLGYNPVGALTLDNGILYFESYNGSTNNLGGLLKYDISTGVCSLILAYDSLNTGHLQIGLPHLQNNDKQVIGGNIYVLTMAGAGNNEGAILKVNTSTGAYTKIHDVTTTAPQISLVASNKAPSEVLNNKYYLFIYKDLHIIDLANDNLTIVDLGLQGLITTSVGSRPTQAFKDGNFIYIKTDGMSQFIKFDTTTNTIVRHATLATQTGTIFFKDNNAVYSVSYQNTKVYKWDEVSNIIAATTDHSLSFSADGTLNLNATFDFSTGIFYYCSGLSNTNLNHLRKYNVFTKTLEKVYDHDNPPSSFVPDGVNFLEVNQAPIYLEYVDTFSGETCVTTTVDISNIGECILSGSTPCISNTLDTGTFGGKLVQYTIDSNGNVVPFNTHGLDNYLCSSGTTIEPTYTLGCTNPNSSNYNPLANVDDGSCCPELVSGCTCVDATNYNPLANFDDGSCIFNLNGADIVSTTETTDLDVFIRVFNNVNKYLFIFVNKSNTSAYQGGINGSYKIKNINAKKGFDDFYKETLAFNIYSQSNPSTNGTLLSVSDRMNNYLEGSINDFTHETDLDLTNNTNYFIDVNSKSNFFVDMNGLFESELEGGISDNYELIFEIMLQTDDNSIYKGMLNFDFSSSTTMNNLDDMIKYQVTMQKII